MTATHFRHIRYIDNDSYLITTPGKRSPDAWAHREITGWSACKYWSQKRTRVEATTITEALLAIGITGVVESVDVAPPPPDPGYQSMALPFPTDTRGYTYNPNARWPESDDRPCPACNRPEDGPHGYPCVDELDLELLAAEMAERECLDGYEPEYVGFERVVQP